MPSFLTMWRAALSRPVLIETRIEWDRLDPLSKWLISARAHIAILSVLASLIGGVLAWEHLPQGKWLAAFFCWLIITIGLFAAHGLGNLVSDLVDHLRGSGHGHPDSQYTRPLEREFISQHSHYIHIGISGIVTLLAGFYAWNFSGYSLMLVWLFIAGAAILASYSLLLKRFGLGEAAVLLIWGPLMITGIHVALVGGWNWMIVLASLPFGLSVAAANNAGHIDDCTEDASRGIRTLPVIIGESYARWATIGAIFAAYLITLLLVWPIYYLTPAMIVTLVALRAALPAVRRLLFAKPVSAPEDHPTWPMWFRDDCLSHSAAFGRYFALALFIDALMRLFPSSFWCS